ncbi:MAG TPA: AGE family epimerase/isomerase [Segeticoccus sp.]|uniref:AGE family epimerase/isomerase n=1 Tax=Segeticoccus sp. TaxID=2706531 RepID=UPI002D7F4051|nr:AGE family epimerase/isomerase [Segeticoccus sp.]HET8601481.1 AGE family epimerase/isomerase [Segeticoccus sp.]
MNWLDKPAHARWLEAEGDRLLEFGRAARNDRPPGGFAWLDDDGKPDGSRPVELWVTCRMTHVYALAHLMGRPGSVPLVDAGLAALRGSFHDEEHGGWYAALGPGGEVRAEKTAYEHAFVLLSSSSAVVAGRPGARDLLDEALSTVLDHFWDERHQMIVDSWDREFATLDSYRGVNANMHMVEAFLATADVLDDPSLRERALHIATRVVHDLAAANGWHIPEHFTPDWEPLLDYHREEPAHPFQPYGATIGHSLEWARLILQLREALGPDAPTWMLDDARALVDTAVRDGWAVDGADGFVYTVDWDGAPVVRERMHWVPAEATATAATLHRLTGEERYAEWYQTWWDYLACHVIDRERGSWHHELSPRNGPSSTTWSGKPDVYHAFQATLLPRLPVTPCLSVALRSGLLA